MSYAPERATILLYCVAATAIFSGVYSWRADTRLHKEAQENNVKSRIEDMNVAVPSVLCTMAIMLVFLLQFGFCGSQFSKQEIPLALLLGTAMSVVGVQGYLMRWKITYNNGKLSGGSSEGDGWDLAAIVVGTITFIVTIVVVGLHLTGHKSKLVKSLQFGRAEMNRFNF